MASDKAHEKGRVENGVGYVKQNFLAGLELPAWTALNPAARQWLETMANVRIHGETHQDAPGALRPGKVQAQARLEPCPMTPATRPHRCRSTAAAASPWTPTATRCPPRCAGTNLIAQGLSRPAAVSITRTSWWPSMSAQLRAASGLRKSRACAGHCWPSAARPASSNSCTRFLALCPQAPGVLPATGGNAAQRPPSRPEDRRLESRSTAPKKSHAPWRTPRPIRPSVANTSPTSWNNANAPAARARAPCT